MLTIVINLFSLPLAVAAVAALFAGVAWGVHNPSSPAADALRHVEWAAWRVAEIGCTQPSPEPSERQACVVLLGGHPSEPDAEYMARRARLLDPTRNPLRQ